MGLDKVDEVATGLARLRGKACANEKADVPEPSFMAIITGVGETAYRRSDGIYVIPVRTLGGIRSGDAAAERTKASPDLPNMVPSTETHPSPYARLLRESASAAAAPSRQTPAAVAARAPRPPALGMETFG